MALAFEKTGKYILILKGGRDELMLAKCPWRTEDLINEACSLLARNLNMDEWRRYFGLEPYRKTCPSLP
jgi:hypothetical protein